MSKKYRLWLCEIPPRPNWPEVLPGGWYDGTPGPNETTYSRDPRKKKAATWKDPQDAMEFVDDFRDSGYHCYLVPTPPKKYVPCYGKEDYE